MSNIFDITKFDLYKEDNRREVKKSNGGLPSSLWDTYSAFANCYGGVIILGVAENKDGSWRTTGLKAENGMTYFLHDHRILYIQQNPSAPWSPLLHAYRSSA